MARSNANISRRDVMKYGGAAGVGTVIAGCIGGESPDDDAEGEFVYLTTQQPSSIDPARSLDELEGIYNSNVYDPLLRYDDQFPPELTAGVAEDWDLDDDGRTYTFELQDDLEFHNGDPVTADDVAFSIERVMSIREGPSWMWEGLLTEDSATVVDETTVEVELEETFAPFTATMPWLFIVNEDQVLEHEDGGDLGGDWLEDNSAGSGPFELAEYQRGESITLERNDDWWGEFPDGGFAEVTIDIGLEVSTKMGMMRNHDGHLTDRWLAYPNYMELDEADGVSLSETETYNTYYIYMNMLTEPLDDVHVRRAISYAFDYETAMSILGTEDSLNGPLPDAMEHATTDGVHQYEHDLDAAEAELEQSDYDIEDIEVTYVSQPDISANQDIGLMMEDEFSQIGITVNLEDAPWTRIVEMASDPETSPQMFPLWGLIEYDDPDAFLWSMWHSSSVGTYLNGSNYEDDEIDALLQEGRRTIDTDERADIYAEIQQIIAEDAPTLFVANDVTRFGVNSDVSGFADNGIMGYTHQFHNYSQE
ncbi:ABC transporter substrate-binding protein [Halovivax gelatinilyticus]|uniref:ABC transporter substrate-binding protein n=1 Tax=Halovivax gelatinilyticus TaxID=2961597 RepID=UPI0020CA4075|nr:ABC transporter substrate-binding protein [Halovivax gelatinilyticus]